MIMSNEILPYRSIKFYLIECILHLSHSLSISLLEGLIQIYNNEKNAIE